MIKQYITPFSWTNSKAETVINEKDIDDVLKQFIFWLYQTYIIL